MLSPDNIHNAKFWKLFFFIYTLFIIICSLTFAMLNQNRKIKFENRMK